MDAPIIVEGRKLQACLRSLEIQILNDIATFENQTGKVVKDITTWANQRTPNRYYWLGKEGDKPDNLMNYTNKVSVTIEDLPLADENESKDEKE